VLKQYSFLTIEAKHSPHFCWRPLQPDLEQLSGEVAHGFWGCVAADKRVSKGFRQIAADNAVKIKSPV